MSDRPEPATVSTPAPIDPVADTDVLSCGMLRDPQRSTRQKPDGRLAAAAAAAPPPAGLIEALRADPTQPVRPAELARVRRRLEHVSLDDQDVLRGIATKLLLVSSGT